MVCACLHYGFLTNYATKNLIMVFWCCKLTIPVWVDTVDTVYCHLLKTVSVENYHTYVVHYCFLCVNCLSIWYVGVCYLASHSSSLVELDLSGCMSVTNKSLEVLQENLLFARENKTHLNLLIGGNHAAYSYVCIDIR